MFTCLSSWATFGWAGRKRLGQQPRHGRRTDAIDPQEPAVITSLQDLAVRKAARYDVIESWMITKVCHVHDEHCQALLTAVEERKAQAQENSPETMTETVSSSVRRNSPPFQHCTSSVDAVFATTDDDDNADDECSSSSSSCSSSSLSDEERTAHQECSVCMEPLLQGDIVSWSPITTCRHFFHHACIKHWLLRRTECPVCRCTFLPVDHYPVGTLSASEIDDLLLTKKNRLQQPSFYCQQHGCVVLPNQTTAGVTDPTLFAKLHQRAAAAEPNRALLLPSRDNSLLIHGQFCLPISNDQAVTAEAALERLSAMRNDTTATVTAAASVTAP